MCSTLRKRSFRPQVLTDLPACLLLPFLDRDRVFLTDFIPIPQPIVRTKRDDAILSGIMDTAPLEPMNIQVKRIHKPHRPDKQTLIMEATQRIITPPDRGIHKDLLQIKVLRCLLLVHEPIDIPKERGGDPDFFQRTSCLTLLPDELHEPLHINEPRDRQRPAVHQENIRRTTTPGMRGELHLFLPL